jgi:3-deoxy-manno-octulosonate cytidylyltransferase (CMP-KDO synthetase)
MAKTAILIPARYGSTRFPGKPLALLDGTPMIRKVYERCIDSGLDTYVLTDDNRVADAICSHSFYIDKEWYENGTERCAGAILGKTFNEYDKFINVQGDMPDVTAEMIRKIEVLLQDHHVATLYTQMDPKKQNDPTTVKMIRSQEEALWFGRGFTGYGDWHLGVYGYTRYALTHYTTLSIPLEENIEKLEQLRWLKNGWRIGVSKVSFCGTEINTPRDLDEWNAFNSNKNATDKPN